ncbi:pilin [Algiphilus sp.]|uniref:pilin n=1 Tax=Algiphilus sp. TaxID=1872431 RepID=UPI0032F03445
MTHVKKGQQGFTLIELMIVVAIIGILAAIAIPAYQDYTIRAKVTEGVTAANAARASIADYYAANNEFPGTNAEAGLDSTSTDYATAIIQGISVGENGVLTVAFNAIGGETADGDTLVYTPTATAAGAIEWDCDAEAGDGTLPDKYAPANCRGAS